MSDDDDGEVPTRLRAGEQEWAIMGADWFCRNRAAAQTGLDPGIYEYQFNPLNGQWWLARTRNEFTFQGKIYYDTADGVINRVITYWQSAKTNLGVLLNGVRGAGKTVTAQLVANRLIEEEGIPVLVVSNPVPLGMIFDVVKQPLVVIFDEFEKTHDAKAQERLLSIIDGMGRSEYPRLVIFTTNETKIDPSFVDRPSRVRYIFNSDRLSMQVVNMLIDDLLPAHLEHLRSGLSTYLQGRNPLTMDIAKAAIKEAILFEEPPRVWERIFNAAEGSKPLFKISILNPENGEFLKEFADSFTPRYTSEYMLFRGTEEGNSLIDKSTGGTECYSCTCYPSRGGYGVRFLKRGEEAGTFYAHLAMPLMKTPYRQNPGCESDRALWIDDMPEGFTWNPSKKGKKNEEDHLHDLYRATWEYGSMHGTDKFSIYLIQIDEVAPSLISHRFSAHPGANVLMDF